MNDKNAHVSTMYGEIPAAAQLNKVPGFDPLKFLRRTVLGETKETVLQMDLRYKKLWFRLAYPKGRMKLIAQKITEQMAIFEAQIYLDRSDNEPIGNFTATCTCEESQDYIRAAQETALDKALSDAGFGVQIPDGDRQINPVNHEKAPLPVRAVAQKVSVPEPQVVKPPVSKAGAPQMTEPKPSVMASTDRPLTKAASEAVSNPQPAGEITPETKAPVQNITVTHLTPRAAVMPVIPSAASTAENAEEESLPVAPAKTIAVSTRQPASTEAPNNILSIGTAGKVAAVEAATEVLNELPVPPVQTVQEESQTGYTADMSIEEILKRMTFEEAQNVQVDVGTCKGWTLAQVTERRPASLKWYVYGYKDKNNILRAAAQIMLNSLEPRKAG